MANKSEKFVPAAMPAPEMAEQPMAPVEATSAPEADKAPEDKSADDTGHLFVLSPLYIVPGSADLAVEVAAGKVIKTAIDLGGSVREATAEEVENARNAGTILDLT